LWKLREHSSCEREYQKEKYTIHKSILSWDESHGQRCHLWITRKHHPKAILGEWQSIFVSCSAEEYGFCARGAAGLRMLERLATTFAISISELIDGGGCKGAGY
jgi:hypothetical protein